MLAKVIKSTASTNGGYVNTLTVEDVYIHPQFGKMPIKNRYLFKTLEQLEVSEDSPMVIEDFTLYNYEINPIQSINESTGVTQTNKWLVPKY